MKYEAFLELSSIFSVRKMCKALGLRSVDEYCDDCEQDECLGREYEPKESDGKNLPKIIKLFLEYGFDVNAKERFVWHKEYFKYHRTLRIIISDL